MSYIPDVNENKGMRLPHWLLKLLPMWDYVCPKCKEEVPKKSNKCPHCREQYGVPLRVPPKVLKDKKALENYVHQHIFPKVSASQREYLTQFFTVLFSDGFESGDFNAWTSTAASLGCTIETQSTNPHHSIYNAHALTSGVLNNYAYMYKTFAAVDPCYCRAYYKFNQLNLASGDGVNLFQIQYNSYLYSVRALLYNNAGTVLWNLNVLENGAWSGQLGTHTPVTGVWYCIELKRDVANDVETLYIDGVQEATLATAITNNSNGIYMGLTDTPVAVEEAYIDCVVVADAYIGCEATLPKGTMTIAGIGYIPDVISGIDYGKIKYISDLLCACINAGPVIVNINSPLVTPGDGLANPANMVGVGNFPHIWNAAVLQWNRWRQGAAVGSGLTDPIDRWARQLGQIDLARYAGAAVGVANPVDTRETSPTSILNGQVTLTGAAQQFPAGPCKSVTLENPTTNAVVCVGHDNGVTLLNGYRLWPGATVSLDIDNLNRIWVIGTAAQIISYIGVD